MPQGSQEKGEETRCAPTSENVMERAPAWGSPVTLLPQIKPRPQTSCGEVMLVTCGQHVCGAEAGEASLELAW